MAVIHLQNYHGKRSVNSVCVCVGQQIAERDPEHMDECCLVIYQATELRDNIIVALSKVLNLRSTDMGKLMEIQFTETHVKIVNDKTGDGLLTSHNPLPK